MTALLTHWSQTMERYRDEGEWTYPCTPTESGLMTALAAAIFLAPFLGYALAEIFR